MLVVFMIEKVIQKYIMSGFYYNSSLLYEIFCADSLAITLVLIPFDFLLRLSLLYASTQGVYDDSIYCNTVDYI